jgi:glycosyltransferase involved in cell wall biosynthesis
MATSISDITATYNCAHTVGECLASVAGQTWPHRQHVVVDGASTDGTLQLLEAQRAQLAALHSGPDRGIYDALNKAMALATGDVVGFLHADDVYAHADVLAHVAAAFEDPGVSAVYGNLHYVRRDDTTQVVRRWVAGPCSARGLAWGWMPPHPTLYVRRRWYAHIGGFDTRYRIAADYLSVLQLFSQPGFRATWLPEVMVLMRLGGASNRSLRAIARKTAEDWRALRQTRVGALGGVGALVWKNLSKVRQFGLG